MKQDYLQIRVFELASQVYVSGQLYATDVKLLADRGVRSILNNRDDGESEGQPPAADLARVAEECGVRFVHLPVEPGRPTREALEAFAEVCRDLPRPLHLFSRTGARSMRMWEQAEALSLDL